MYRQEQGLRQSEALASRRVALFAVAAFAVFFAGCTDRDLEPQSVEMASKSVLKSQTDRAPNEESDAVEAIVDGGEAYAAIPDYVLIDASTLDRLSKEAALGDPAAAKLVADYYAFREPDSDARKFWEDVATENGSPVLMDFRAQLLWDKGGQYRCLRAEYWFKRAMAADPASASEYAEEIKAMKADPICQKS